MIPEHTVAAHKQLLNIVDCWWWHLLTTLSSTIEMQIAEYGKFLQHRQKMHSKRYPAM